MSKQQFDVEELGKMLGMDDQLMDNLDTEELTEEKQKILEQVIEMYLTDREEFEDFVTDSGLRDLLAKLEDVEVTEIEGQDQLADLKQEVKQKADESELEIDLDI